MKYSVDKLLELGYLQSKHTVGLTPKELDILAKQMNLSVKLADKIKTRSNKEASSANSVRAQAIREWTDERTQTLISSTADNVTKKLQTGIYRIRDAVEAGREARYPFKTFGKPDINKFARKVSRRLARLLTDHHIDIRRLEELIECRDQLHPDELENLDRALKLIADNAAKFRIKLNSPSLSETAQV